MSSALCAVLVGCAGGVDPGPPAVVRTPPPRNVEKTVTDYLAVKIRNPQKNAELAFSAPEPAECTLDISSTASRGWVVPVAYSTRTGEATGRETVRINTKQYYFWFLGSTIAGVTSRIELCPGAGTSFEAPPSAAPVAAPTALPVSTSGDPRSVDTANEQGKATGTKKPSSTKKPSANAPAKKKAAPADKPHG